MEPILLTERYEYEYCVARGYEPLLDIRNFRLDIRLRVEIQRELFGHCVLGRGDIPVANQRFFRWVWEHKPHRCEETLRPLHNFSATYCPHILPRELIRKWRMTLGISIYFALRCTTVGRMATVRKCEYIRVTSGLLNCLKTNIE